MRAVVSILLSLAVGATAGLGLGYGRWHRASASPFEAKRTLILNRAKDTPPGGVVVFGDSIVERQRIESLCGLPALNAGMGSARLADLEPMVSTVLAATRPSRVVVEIGPNDFLVPERTPLPKFKAEFARLLTQVGGRPIVVGMTLPADHPAPEAAAANQAMKAAALAVGGTYVEAVPDAMTEDGLHLNPVGLREWKRRAEEACA